MNLPWQELRLQKYVDNLMEHPLEDKDSIREMRRSQDVAAEINGHFIKSDYIPREIYEPPAEGEIFDIFHPRWMENQQLLELTYYLEDIAPFQVAFP